MENLGHDGTPIAMTDSAAQHRFLDSLAAAPEYAWHVEKPRLSVFERIKLWLLDLLQSLFPDVSVGTAYVLLIIGAAIFLAILVLAIVRLRGGSIRRLRRKSQVAQISSDEELLLDNEQLARNAAAEGRWRDAIRHLYLDFLGDLRDAKLIVWRPEKTNRDYIVEVSASPIAVPFSSVVDVYERSWYGADESTPSDYQNVEAHIVSLRRELSHSTSR